MTNHSCALAEGQFEKGSEEFLLASFAEIGRDRVPHVGDDNNVLQCRVTTEVTERAEIPSCDSGRPVVGDAVDVDDPSKLGTFPISVEKLVRKTRTTNVNGHLHSGHEIYNLQNLLGLRGIIKARGVDESHCVSVQSEFARGLDFGPRREWLTRTTCEIDKLW